MVDKNNNLQIDTWMHWKMLFKFGITVIVLIAIYLYFALKYEENQRALSEKSKSSNLAEDNINMAKNVEVEEEEIKEAVPLSDKEVTVNDQTQPSNSNNERDRVEPAVEIRKSSRWLNSIHLSVVACGDRAEESVVLLKSAVVLSNKQLVFHIFSEVELQKYFIEQLEFWPKEYREKIIYHLYNITFPPEDASEWKKLFKPCASQRLFIPSILTDVDALIYVDTDVLFLRPLEDIWEFFLLFNSTQLAALAPEHEDKATGWYNRFARHPYYGLLGVNSGVMLMNLTRLRSSEWLESMLIYHKEYKFKITWGDQDLINIYFHFHPDELYIYNCEWNYRPDHCMYMSVCKGAERDGASVLHGCRRVYHNDKQPAFRAVYKSFKEHRLGDDYEFGLLKLLKQNLQETKNTPCGKLQNIFTKQIENFVKRKNVKA